MQLYYLSVLHKNSWICWTTSEKFDGEVEAWKTLISMKTDGLCNRNMQNSASAEEKGCSIKNAHAVIRKVPLLTELPSFVFILLPPVIISLFILSMSNCCYGWTTCHMLFESFLWKLLHVQFGRNPVSFKYSLVCVL